MISVSGCGNPEVCIIIPCCNEEDSLPKLRARLQCLHTQLAARYSIRYVAVDDGSTDRTRELIAQAMPDGARFSVIEHDVNRGVGEAFRSGFAEAGAADFICTIDADCTYGPEHLFAMIEKVRHGVADVVVASPYHPDGAVLGVQPWRLGLSRQCSLLYRLASPLKLYTYTSIFRAYRGSTVRALTFQSNHFIAAVEILLSASAHGFTVAEAPMTLRRREAGTSKMRILSTIAEHIKLLAECVVAPDHFPRRLCLSQGGSNPTVAASCRSLSA